MSAKKLERNRQRRAVSARATQASVAAREPDGVFAAYVLPNDEVEDALRTGQHAAALETYFGEAAYADLRRLALQADSTRRTRSGARVLLLPGIMGSKLGLRRAILDDVLWIDPIDFALGNLTKLTLDGRPRKVEALGVVLFAYLKLKLTLQIAGFDAEFHAYDWRQPIPTLGAALAKHIRAGSGDVHLVTHSMGALVARAALASNLPQVQRLIMLGPPSYGSFSVPQALRASHEMVRMVAALDVRHSAEELTERVFSSFPGLYQMMPWREKFSAVDLYDAGSWPQLGPRPRQPLLDGIEASQRALAQPDERMVVIAGVDRDTAVSLQLSGGEFVYTQTRAGDGTVPLELARLPGVKTYLVPEEHGNLANNHSVASATIDLLRQGTTDRLPTDWAPRRGLSRRSSSDSELRIEPFDGRQGSELSPSEVRHVLSGFVSPPTAVPGEVPALTGTNAAEALALQPAASGGRFQSLVVGRRRQHRLDVTLALGSITEVDARAYVLGVFEHVDPAGAARAIDQRLDGAISELIARRMLSGGVGEPFVLPVGRSTLRTDMVVMAGLGSFDALTPAVQSLAAENVIRLFIKTRLEELATVLFGTGSGHGVRESLTSMCAGFLRGLSDADRNHSFRRLVFCEQDPVRFQELKVALYDLASSQLFESTEVTIDELTLPAPPEPADGSPSRRQRLPGARDPIYVIARESPRSDGALVLDVALLGADGKAAVVSDEVRIPRQELNRQLSRLESAAFDFDRLPKYGVELAELVLPASVRAQLTVLKDRHLVVVHDAVSSRIPWELLHLSDGPPPRRSRAAAAPRASKASVPWAPALACGVSRRYLAHNLSIAKWLEARREDGFLHVLLIVNPTEDLPGAKQEGKRLRAALGESSAVRLTELAGKAATREELLKQLTSGKYDVVHYAGHAQFNARSPARSGILCAREEVLSGLDLAQVGNLPSLVFFNACEAARIRRGAARQQPELALAERVQRSTSLAEAFLRGGAANYLGTYWPVGDDAAKLFARTFYGELLTGNTVALALLSGRKALHAAGELDWADYVHYGNPDFVVKTRVGAAVSAGVNPSGS